MKIRALTCGLSLEDQDFSSYEYLYAKFSSISKILLQLQSKLQISSYEVQTTRITLNSFENWIPWIIKEENDQKVLDLQIGIQRIQLVIQILNELQISFCSIGCATTQSGVECLPQFLSLSSNLCANALIQTNDQVLSLDLALLAAKVAVELSKQSSDGLKNFSYCVSFNCPPNIPFFPGSYHRNASLPVVTVGLECGELLFIAFHGVTDPQQASENLRSAYQQTLTPIQEIMKAQCEELDILYGGIDASMNPGLSIVESVGKGMEELIPSHIFGSWGTLSTVSTITKAIKSLAPSILLCGYSGLMLPVMEDLQLSSRAAELSSYTLRDLLIYSSVCGVGLDTVPIPGDTSPEQLRDVYLDIAALASRLNKPLSCRLLLMPGLSVGDMTDVSSPYLCNTRVFAV
jgi:uncharacterized protein